MLARCRVHEVSQEWGCEWGSSYMNESIHSVSSHDCRFLPSRMRWCSLLITPCRLRALLLGKLRRPAWRACSSAITFLPSRSRERNPTARPAPRHHLPRRHNRTTEPAQWDDKGLPRRQQAAFCGATPRRSRAGAGEGRQRSKVIVG